MCVCVFASDEELDNRSAHEEFVELDSLDTEKALLLTDSDEPLWVCNQSVLKLLFNIQIFVLLNLLLFPLFLYKPKWLLSILLTSPLLSPRGNWGPPVCINKPNHPILNAFPFSFCRRQDIASSLFLCSPGSPHLEVRRLRAVPLSGGVSYSAAGVASGVPLSPCFSVMSSCTLPSSSSSPTCSCSTSDRRRS